MSNSEIENLMLHYIFNASAHLTSWTAPTIKSWLKLAKDPLLDNLINNMKGAQAQLDFLLQFPQYFKITEHKSIAMTSVKIKEGGKCPHCQQYALNHRSSHASSSSPSSPSASSSPSSTTPYASPTSSNTASSIAFATPTSIVSSTTTSPVASSTASTTTSTTTSSTVSTSATASSATSSTTSSTVSATTFASASPTSIPSTCSHDELFRFTYQCLKDLPGGTNVHQLRHEIIQKLTDAGRKDILQQIRAITPKEYSNYFQPFPCFSIRTVGKKNIIIRLTRTGSKSFCTCVGDSIAPPSATTRSCGHSDIFCEIYRVLKTADSPPTRKQLRETLIERLSSSNSTVLVQWLENSNSTTWKNFLKSLHPYIEKHGIHVNLSSNFTCQCLSDNDISTPNVDVTTALNDLQINESCTMPIRASDPISSSPQSPLPSIINHASTVAIPLFVKKSGQHFVGLVESLEQCQQAIHYIQAFATVALDCEGVNLSKTGKLCFVQIAVLSSSNTFIFDLIVLEKLPQFKEACDSLASVLQDPNILKVVHDGRQDCSALHHQLHISVTSIKIIST